MSDTDSAVPYGYCQCGCGQKAAIASENKAKRGWVKGKPLRYARGHNGRTNRWTGPRYRVEDRGHDTPCWIWQHGKDRNGYGYVGSGKTRRRAHRAAYEEMRGPLPPDVDLHHECEVKACVNPDHLTRVSTSEHNLIHARYGEDNPSFKYSVDDIERFREIHESGVSLRQISKRYGVHYSYLSELLNGKVRKRRRRS